jgi:hypothetical protein
VKNRTIFGLLFFLTLIASTVFGSLAENPRQGFNGIFTGLHQGGTLSKAATTPGVSACFLESSRQVFLLGQGGKGLGKTAELEKRLEEHIKKLQEYIKNPLANDNKNFLKNAPTQGIEDSIITGRVKHLVDEIKNLTNLINQGGGQ